MAQSPNSGFRSARPFVPVLRVEVRLLIVEELTVDGSASGNLTGNSAPTQIEVAAGLELSHALAPSSGNRGIICRYHPNMKRANCREAVGSSNPRWTGQVAARTLLIRAQA